MTNLLGLRPCPFCGGAELRITNRRIENAPGYGYSLFEIGHVPRLSLKCFASVSAETREAAVERWNMRVPEDRLRATLVRLVGHAEDVSQYWDLSFALAVDAAKDALK
jgi:hypothetical protein